MDTLKHDRHTICPKCGQSFICNPNGICWCVKFTIPAENLEFLKKTYPDCLCPECLKGFEASAENQPAGTSD